MKKNGTVLPSVVSELLDTQSLFSNEFGDWNRNFLNWGVSAGIPSVNVTESEGNFRIELAAPGLEKKDFKIEINENVLTISAEKEKQSTEEDIDYKRKEFSYSNFSRSFQLPANVFLDNVNAKYENGVLKLIIPKKETNSSKSRKEITIS